MTHRLAGEPIVTSEQSAWHSVLSHAMNLRRGRDMREIRGIGLALEQLATHMLAQLGRGVHHNPASLVALTNPPRGLRSLGGGEVMSRDVLGLVYVHAADGRNYAHPFGRGTEVAVDNDGEVTFCIGKSAHSGIEMLALSDGELIVLRHKDGNKLSEDF